jgi:aspartyl-tRNA(Asn)/glutamyl-tRNA(Gln) amidotransferase subunit A
VAEAARRLEALGHAVEEGEVPFDVAALDRILAVVAPAGLAWFLRDRPGWEGVVQDALRRVAEQGAAISAADYLDALDEITRLRAEFVEVFERCDVILTPCFAALPWAAEATHPETIDGRPAGPRRAATLSLRRSPTSRGFQVSVSLATRQKRVFQLRCSSWEASAVTNCC